MKTLLTLIGINAVLASHSGFGPWVQSSKGKIWPRPQVQKDYPTILSINPQSFHFKIVGQDCDLVTKAVKRISSRLFNKENTSNLPSPLMNNVNYEGDLMDLEVNLAFRKGCDEKYPVMNMDEHYEIRINPPDNPGIGQLVAFSAWGIIRGLESFTHLVYSDNGKYFVNSTLINDFPRFPYRGLMLDTSRHFLPIATILETLDLMEMSKYNVLHWHMTDDPSFPFQSLVFPQLSFKGSYSKKAIYTHADVSRIVEEARLRGIRVIPEFDTPGHTASWGEGMPEVLTSCPSAPDHERPLNPIKENVYTFLKALFKEVMNLFPDNYLHLGGDEVDKTCWENNAGIVQFMKQKNWTSYNKLQDLYVNNFTDILMNLDSKTIPIVWEEIFNDGADLDKRTIIHVWKASWGHTMKNATEKGYKVVLSSPFYLNDISYGIHWPKYYKVDPTNFDGDEHQRKKVLGGETCLWGEFINRFNLIDIGWPRSCVVAERLWSSKDVMDVQDAAKRLEEHTCRLIKRGFNVAPANGPNYCDR